MKKNINPLLAADGRGPPISFEKKPHHFRSPSSPKTCVAPGPAPAVQHLQCEALLGCWGCPEKPGGLGGTRVLAALMQGQIYKPCKLVLKIHSEFGPGISCVFFVPPFFRKSLISLGRQKHPTLW